MSLLLAGVYQDIRARNNLWARQGGCVVLFDGSREWSSVTFYEMLLVWRFKDSSIRWWERSMLMRSLSISWLDIENVHGVCVSFKHSLFVKRSWNGHFEWCITEMWFIVWVTHHLISYFAWRSQISPERHRLRKFENFWKRPWASSRMRDRYFAKYGPRMKSTMYVRTHTDTS